MSYWSQWSHSELMSMQGVELEDHYDCHDDDHYDVEVSQDEDDAELERQCCSGCMDCLGLSWRDFY